MSVEGGKDARLIPCARARYSFDAQSDVELSFSAGVSIRLLRRIDENWLEGELEGKVGIFPANHVDIELSSPSLSHENELARSGKPYAIGLYDFAGGCEGDLPFTTGELIELLGSVGSGWMMGKTVSGEGIFPASFVEILKLPDTPDGPVSPPPSPVYATPDGTVPPPKSPVYALPFLEEKEGEGEREGGGGGGGEGERVLVNGLANGVSHPKRPPRRKSAPNNSQSVCEEGACVRGEEGEGEGVMELSTPSRSAPAPPTGDSPAHHHSSTLPRPKPRQRNRKTSLSAVEQQMKTLESGLAIEKTLLHSAKHLLEVSSNEAKREKLQASITAHHDNVRRLKGQIKELKAQREVVAEANSTPPLLPPSPPQKLQPPQPPSMEKQRSKVINELVSTERDYHSEMRVCCEKLLPAVQEIPDINTELLFGNIREVTQVSHDFLHSLDEACKNGENVGRVFVKFGPKLKSTYAVYCRSHDTASALLEKYMENTVLTERLKGCLDRVKAETQAWDLQSLLIKPVQRVLKYPLLLNKLIETTQGDHPDYKAVLQAKDVIAQVAQDINEFKRRKDLVERYTGGSREDRRGTVSVHSFQKKVRRIQQKMTQFTGLRSKTVDPKFDEVEQKLTSLEMLLQQLIKDITAWQEALQRAVESRETLCEGMALYVSDCKPLSTYQHAVMGLQQTVKSHSAAVTTHVLTPFKSLQALFQDPLHLITKRRDKLLDYDNLQYTLDRTEEPDKIKQLRDDCLMAKRNYEALNEQLLEELPHFIQLAANMIHHTLTVYVQLQFKFHTTAHTLMERLTDNSVEGEGGRRPQSSIELQADHNTAMAGVSQRLIQLSIVPASLAMTYNLSGSLRVVKKLSSERVENGSLEGRERERRGGGGNDGGEGEGEGEGEGVGEEEGGEEEGAEEVAMSDSLLSSSIGSPDPLSSTFSSEVEMDLAEEPPEPPQGSELVVMYDFEAQDKAELSVSAGHTVILLCPHDRIGCSEWWLVQSEHGTGYVPASFLDYHGNDALN